MSDYSSNLDGLSESQTGKVAAINELFDATSPSSIFGRRESTSQNLTWGYYGGRWGGVLTANGVVTLSASSTNYLVRKISDGSISVSTSNTNWNNTSSYQRLYLITTDGSGATDWEDHRGGEYGVVGVGIAGRTACLSYVYSTTTTSGDPGSGGLRLNNTTLASATALYISETDNDTNAVGPLLATWDDSTSTVKGVLAIRGQNNPAQLAVYTVSGTLTDNGTWDTLTLTNVLVNGTFSDGDLVLLTFTRTGDKGDTGATGSTGSTGAAGADGHGATTTTGTFTVAAASSTQTVAVGDGTAFPADAYCFIGDGTHSIIGQVTGGGGTTSLTVTTVQVISGSAGDTMASGAAVTFSGYTSPSALTNPMTTAGDIIVGGASGTPARLAIGSNGQILGVVSGAQAWLNYKQAIQIACSDETTALTTGTAKTTFRVPYAFTLSAVRASLTTAQTSGSILTVDVKKNGTSIFSTTLTIDNTEKTSTTAATAAVLSTTSLSDDDEITIDITQVGDGTAKGLKVSLIGTPT